MGNEIGIEEFLIIIPKMNSLILFKNFKKSITKSFTKNELKV